MFNDIKVKLNTNSLLIYERNGKVIIYNKDRKRHVKLSEEVYKYIIFAEEKKLNIKEFIDCFKNENDRKYILSIIKIMINNGIINGKTYEGKFFKDIHLSLTNRCNLNCKHCVTNCSPKEKDYMSTKQVFKLIDNLHEINVRNLVLTGGEPLIRSDLFEIVRYIKIRLPLVELSLSTNGTLIDDTNINFIVKSFDKIDISLDGVDEKTCSSIRGKGVFQKVLKAVQNLHGVGFYNISLSMVFGEKNCNQLEKFKLLNEKLGTRSIERYFIPKGRGLINRKVYTDEDSTLPLIIPKLHELDTKNNKQKPLNVGSCSCNGCIEQIFITHDGKVYPCPSLIDDEYLIGSIFEDETVNVLKFNDFSNNTGFKNFNKLFPYNFEKCKECDVNIFCLKCPSRVHVLKNSDKELDKWCSLMKKSLEMEVWGENL